MIILGNALVSGVCCEKLKNGGKWCQIAANENECDTKYAIWRYQNPLDDSCVGSVPECSGTCVNAITGECSETPKTECKEAGGDWSEKSPEEIPACQEVCCILDVQEAYFLNPKKCKTLFIEYGVDGEIRDDITSRESCEELQISTEIGACVISTLTEDACGIETKTKCTNNNINYLKQYLKNKDTQNEIDVRFYEGFLCTASIRGVEISDCAPSANTECKDNKVYYKDLCGNFANIYNARMFSENRNSWTIEMIDYWTDMKDPYYSDDVCTVTSSGSTTCGNCDSSKNTVCKDYKEVEGASKPQNNLNGLICGDLSCKYKGQTYEHGESWCEGTAGTFDIERNLTTSVIFKTNITALKNVNKYNIPGSRYYKLLCADGEVLVEECGDYRHSVCMQGEDEAGDNRASCVFNPWRTCLSIETKTECEDSTSLCKWIPGYTWVPGQIVPESQRKERQGSCSPLVAPGFDFWKGTSQGNGICKKGFVQEFASFETGIFTARKTMTGTNIDSWPFKHLANNCLDGCYAIPKYAIQFNQIAGEEKQYPEEINCPEGTTNPSCSLYDILTEFYDESGYKLSGDVKNYYLSTRRGQYCHKDGKPDQWLTGLVRGPNYDCTAIFEGARDERKERDYPIYLTHDEWFKGITERARSLGDCGYKINLVGKYSDPETEIITAIFQKMTQKGAVKENITVEQIIYMGGKAMTGDLQAYETILPYKTTSYTCAPDHKGICDGNPEPCEGGTVQEAGEEGEALCPEKMVCCIYTELGA